MQLNDEQLRVAANLRQFYDAWLVAERGAPALSGSVHWKTIGGRQYLYRTDSKGNGTSLGPRSAATEETLAAFNRDRAASDDRLRGVREQLRIAGTLYRTLRMSMIASPAGAILREADVRGLLGHAIIVVGTSTLAAYELEATIRFPAGLEATQDFDLAWMADNRESFVVAGALQAPLLSVLKAVDPTYVVNSERPFQARNRNAYEVEILLAPSLAGSYPPAEPLRPTPLPEQEWLLRGRHVDQVVCARDGTAARIVAPDPRWFALHKLWLADKPTRSPLKARKDRQQGHAVLHAVKSGMPHYPLDEAFAASLPAELSRYLTNFADG